MKSDAQVHSGTIEIRVRVLAVKTKRLKNCLNNVYLAVLYVVLNQLYVCIIFVNSFLRPKFLRVINNIDSLPEWQHYLIKNEIDTNFINLLFQVRTFDTVDN